ncbi:phenylacetic acid degradation protein PaaN, partial [Streptomyces prunicolor]|nr:phenylacetic acid degradation protein PaaN [Streptomyces prunicolor]
MLQTSSELPDFFSRHRALLEQAVAATATRDHWTPYPESPSKSVYGEDAAKNGEAAFQEQLGGHFELAEHPGDGRVSAAETSPYGFELGISYPRVAPDEAVAAALAATGP